MKVILPSNYYSGLSGLKLKIPKYLFPPPYQDSSRLHYYSTLFNSIEINSIFYNLPLIRTIHAWTQIVQDDFNFTYKMWKSITHVDEFIFLKQDVIKFFETISSNQNKRGSVLIQLPPRSGITHFKQLKNLLEEIKYLNVSPGWLLAIEFRNRTWYHPHVYDLLEMHNVTIVRHDIPASSTPYLQINVNHVYIRFHGPTGNYRGSYSPEFLQEYAFYIKEWLVEGKKVFVYFNNTMGEAFENLQQLNKLVSETANK